MSQRTFLGPSLQALDAAGKELRKALDSLWVPYDEATGSGAVHWHAQAAAHLQTALDELTILDAKLRAVDWPEDGG